MTYIMAIGVLKSKQQELIESMQDKSKTPTEILADTFMYDDISKAISVLNREFFEEREQPNVQRNAERIKIPFRNEINNNVPVERDF